MTSQPETPEASRLLVAITFHYDDGRVPYLLDVIRALNDFPVRGMRIVIMVNAIGDAGIDRLRALLAPGLAAGKTLVIQRCDNLEHPFDLTWAHKRLVTDVFLAAGSTFTHFIYLEDDMRFGYANFCYFLRFRPLLDAHGLIPSFVRVEYSALQFEMRLTDSFAPPAAGRPLTVVADAAFLPPQSPYCALYVLDRALAADYVTTRSFDMHASTEVSEWGVRERAAMGLCWENPPPGFESRYVVALDRATGFYAAEAWVPHLPSNYVDDPDTPFGKLPVLAVPADSGA